MLVPLSLRMLLIGVVCMSVGCLKNASNSHTEPELVTVTAVVVGHQPSFTRTINYYGRIEPARRTELSFEFAGLLNEVSVDEGHGVSAGDVVARLDTKLLEAEKSELVAQRRSEAAVLERLKRGERDEVIAAARAEVNRLEVELERFASEKARAEKAHAGRSISQAEFDAALFSYQAAAHSLEQARKQLEELSAGTRIEDIQAQEGRLAATDARIELMEIRLAKSTLTAPYDGVCVGRIVDEGAALAPGQPVLRINESHRLEARFAVARRNIKSIDDTESLQINGQEYSISGARRVMQVDEATRTVDVIFPIQVGAEDGILPGQVCTLSIQRHVDSECIELPFSALISSARGLWSCYVLQQHASEPDVYSVKKYDVQIIYTDGRHVIVAATLPERSLVVNEGGHKVTPSMLVRVVGVDP
ncbi:putative efflux pump membrane fusion protein [Stieleria maiorica]|uniref:Putative efflux pump membrane fusion protein n=1 Tax=Stieleria maiorica TaxID=2795974 RepID=A0A5B9MFQ8_9BACT|nr:HlyD family secretion protein [Stieleria maiorica]QEF99673.1 putative efflux pump membrane fusion protein [Stieleria maiorica]